MNFQPRPILPAAVEVGAPPTHCCWPMWNDQERATHVYCGAAVAENKPYCPAHCQRAYYNPGAPPKLDYLLRERALPEDAAPLVPVMTKVVIKPERKAKAEPKPRQKRINKSGLGPGVYARVNSSIDIRLCINDVEREIIAAWNAGKSQREIGRERGVSHNTIAGKCSRIRARRLEG